MHRLIALVALAAALLAGRASAQAPADAPSLTPAQLAILQYNYIVFPRQIDALRYDAALAERYAAFMQDRVNSYRPFRSFHQYAATYSADQRAQLELFAAQQNLACVRQGEIDLWRERQAVVAALLLQEQAAAQPR